MRTSAVPFGDLAHPALALQRLADQVRQGVQLTHHLRSLNRRQVAHPAEIEGQHGQDGDLVGERLGAGHADLGAGVEVDAAVGLPRDAAADDVAQGQRRVPLALALAQGGQRVGRLAGLGQGQHDGVAVQRRVAVAELAGVLDLDRHARELLEQVLADQRRVVARAARRHHDPLGLAQPLHVEVEAAEVGRAVGLVQPAAQGVLQRLGLFVDLLEHEMVEAARVLFLGRRFQHRGRPASPSRRGWVEDAPVVRRQHAQLMVVQIDHLLGEAGEGAGVAGEEAFALAEAQDQWAA